jgi:hypothetical protein
VDRQADDHHPEDRGSEKRIIPLDLITRSPIPPKPDPNAVNDWMISAYERSWRTGSP